MSVNRIKFVILLLLIVSPTLALEVGPITFNGFAEVDFELDTIFGKSQNKPATTIRFAIQPQIGIYGMPLTFDIMLNREQGTMANNLDYFSLNFLPGVPGLKLPSILTLLTLFKGVHVGATTPEFSDAVLSGSVVNGILIEMNPRTFYFAFSSGGIEPELTMAETTETTKALGVVNRSLVAARFGIGAKDAPHFHLLALHAADYYPDTIPSDSLPYPPMENFVFGVNMLNRTGESSALEMELDVCEVTVDTRAPILVDEKIPDWFRKTFRPRSSSHFDFAFKTRLTARFGSSDFSAQWKFVGPGYESFGLWGQRNDINQVDANANFAVVRNLLSANTGFLWQTDNVLGTKDVTTKTNQGRLYLNITPAGMPYFSIGNEVTLQKVGETNYWMLNSTLISGYGYPVGRVNMSTQLSLGYSRSDFSDSVQNALNSLLSGITQSFMFPVQLSLDMGVNYERRWYTYGEPAYKLDLDISSTYYVAHADMSLGFSACHDFDAAKFGLYSRFQWSMPWDAALYFFVSWDYVKPDDESKYSELRAQLRLSKSW